MSKKGNVVVVVIVVVVVVAILRYLGLCREANHFLDATFNLKTDCAKFCREKSKQATEQAAAMVYLHHHCIHDGRKDGIIS